MPNYCYNFVTFHGDKSDIKKLFTSIKSKKECFDFDKVVPMPACLNIEVSRNILNLANQTNPDISQVSPSDLKLYKQCIQNIKSTGYAFWYDWRIINWGTKWNAVDPDLVKNSITFLTAWDGPTPVMKSLSKKFPSILLDWLYHYEDDNFVYEHIIFRGETIRHEEHSPYDHFWAKVYFTFSPDEKGEFALCNLPNYREFYFNWQNIYGVEELGEGKKGEF